MRSSAYSPGTGKPGPLCRTIRARLGETGLKDSVWRALLTRADLFVIWECNVYYVKCDW